MESRLRRGERDVHPRRLILEHNEKTWMQVCPKVSLLHQSLWMAWLRH